MTCPLSKNKRSAAEHCVNLSFIGRWTDRGTGSLRQQNALAFDTAERERGGDRVGHAARACLPGERDGRRRAAGIPSVVAAVECAIAMQKQMADRNAGIPEARRILYRIGVNLGDVLIDGEDILGDGVNIAARLEGICEPGGVCISGSAYDHVRGRIDADFVDFGERMLKNIAQPVRVHALGVGEIARASASTPPRPVPVKPVAPALLGIAALLIVVAAGGWYWFIANRPAAVATGPPAAIASNAAAPAEAKHLSMVVLPFANLSGDPSQDYFADGVTENLTTELSRIHDSFVIARNTVIQHPARWPYEPERERAASPSLSNECACASAVRTHKRRRGQRLAASSVPKLARACRALFLVGFLVVVPRSLPSFRGLAAHHAQAAFAHHSSSPAHHPHARSALAHHPHSARHALPIPPIIPMP